MKKARKSYENPEFIHSKSARELRILAEYLEPKARFEEMNIEKAVIFYGSARLLSRKAAQEKMKLAQTTEEKHSASQLIEMSSYYEEAVDLAAKLTRWTISEQHLDERYRICTGGGPGIMEAVNRGAASVDRDYSIGLNISLPFEQFPNDYISEKLNFEFHYFFMRKFWFMKLAEALVIFPGGFGTCDELFETLTLIQTGKKGAMPIILFGESFWKSLINFDQFLSTHLVSKKDLELLHFVETADEAFKIIKESLTHD